MKAKLQIKFIIYDSRYMREKLQTDKKVKQIEEKNFC